MEKLAVVITGSGRAFVSDPAPFLGSVEGGTLGVLCLEIRSRARPFGSFAAVSYRWSVHSGWKSGWRGRSIVVRDCRLALICASSP